MRSADNIVRDILILKLGEANTAETEKIRLMEIVRGLDSDMVNGMLSSLERFVNCLQMQSSGAEISKTTLSMLNVVYKTHTSPKSISMLGKLLSTENGIHGDYTLVLLYRLLEQTGLTIQAVPNNYTALREGISGNKLLDFTEPMWAEISPDLSDADLLKALFIMNDEPEGDISSVRECAALLEYKEIISEATDTSGILLAKISDYTSYPNMVLAMGLCALAKAGRPIEFQKDTFERLVMSIIKKEPIDWLAAGL